MIIKCISCDKRYNTDTIQQCPSCGVRGGFCQEPQKKSFSIGSLHLEEILKHSVTQVMYQIKEFQNNGIIVKVHHTIVPGLVGKRAYISNKLIGEYERVE